MEILQFMFQSFWHFVGCFLILCVIGQTITCSLEAISKIFKK